MERGSRRSRIYMRYAAPSRKKPKTFQFLPSPTHGIADLTGCTGLHNPLRMMITVYALSVMWNGVAKSRCHELLHAATLVPNPNIRQRQRLMSDKL